MFFIILIVCRANFRELIELLKRVHTQTGLIHRDVTIFNVFQFNDHIMLNDWGCAATMGVETVFSGNTTFAPQYILEKIILQGNKAVRHTPTPKDDLEMVLKLFYLRINVYGCLIPPDHTSIDDIREIYSFWEEQFRPSVWTNLAEVARKSDYESLAKDIGNLIV